MPTLRFFERQGFTAVYVNDVPGTIVGPKSGGYYVRRSDGTASLKFKAETSDGDREMVAAATLASYGPRPVWDDLLALAAEQPARGGGRPGRRPGMTAASRRDADFGGGPSWMETAAAGPWTAQDADELGLEFKRDPFPSETLIRVDHREPAAMVDRFRSVPLIKVEIASLPVGDYEAPGRLVIERKTAQDFITSLVEDSKRLFTQSMAAARSGVPAVMIIEGDVFGSRRTGIPQITGALSYLATIQGVCIVPTISENHTAYTILKLVRHACHGLGYDLALRASGPRSPLEAAAYTLEGLPGVSANLAHRLLGHFGSFRGVASATEDQLRQVAGIGQVKAREIAAVLGAGSPASPAAQWDQASPPLPNDDAPPKRRRGQLAPSR